MTDLRGSWHWRAWLREPLLTLPIALLLIIGAAMVCSATVLCENANPGLAVRHGIAMAVGLLAAGALAWLPLRTLGSLATAAYLASVVLLAAVLAVGEKQYGARRWLDLGPIQLQPSEPAKIAVILCLAGYLAHKRHDLRRPRWLLGAIGLIALPFVLVAREPDLGTALAFPAVGTIMLIWAGLPWFTLGLLASPFLTVGLSLLPLLAASTGRSPSLLAQLLWLPIVAGGVMLLRSRAVAWTLVVLFALVQVGVALETPRIWRALEPYQRSRVVAFLNPEFDPAGAGYQVIQSKIAIGSGIATGNGYGKGSQKALAFLPRQHTDFIYSVLGEELGFAGSATALALFAAWILRCLVLAVRVRSAFGSLIVVGGAGLIFYHVAVNIAMTLGFAPVTGLPLPFMSFGGSFLVVALGTVGMVLSVAARRNEY
ncbi:MAG: rod shape-determining protein RodA [Candidatus Eisenbacteria bacterium]